MQLAMSTVKAKKDNGLVYDSVTEGSIKKTVEDFKNDIKQKDTREIEKSLRELRNAKQARIDYCSKQNITSNCPTAHYDELIKIAEKRKVYINSPDYKKQLDENGFKLEAVLLAKNKMDMMTTDRKSVV